MNQVLTEEVREARKDHYDISAEFIIYGLLDHRPCGEGLTFREWRAIAELKANGWKIKKGQAYIYQCGKQDGEWYRFRSLATIIKICQKLNLYEQ